jgi:hypothetical protein
MVKRKPPLYHYTWGLFSIDPKYNDYQNSLQWCSYTWKILELGLKVYDQSQAHGHLKGQKLLFGWKWGYHISHNLQHYYLAHEYKSFGWILATSYSIANY